MKKSRGFWGKMAGLSLIFGLCLAGCKEESCFVTRQCKITGSGDSRGLSACGDRNCGVSIAFEKGWSSGTCDCD